MAPANTALVVPVPGMGTPDTRQPVNKPALSIASVEQRPRRHLPSMRALQALEAAARHLSFTRAAAELNLTQTAISHQIRNLEETVGQRLFDRDGGRLSLTRAGKEYANAARLVISEISSAGDRASTGSETETVTIAARGAYLSKTLMPVIAEFAHRHPEIRLVFRTLSPSGLCDLQDYDVAIDYGVGNWPGMSVFRLADEEVFPVCSPRLLSSLSPLREPGDLVHHTIIRTDPALHARDDWAFWQYEAGIPAIRFRNEIFCNQLLPAFDAAIHGLGIVMGRSTVVQREIDEGRLVEPFDLRIASPSIYHLLIPIGHERYRKVAAFRDWLLEKLA